MNIDWNEALKQETKIPPNYVPSWTDCDSYKQLAEPEPELCKLTLREWIIAVPVLCIGYVGFKLLMLAFRIGGIGEDETL
jgi:hypothetical protein